MKIYKLLLALLYITLFFSQHGIAQKRGELEYSGFFDSYYFRGPIAITVGGGFVGYKGDICGGLACNTLKNVFSLGVNYKVWPRTVFGVELSHFNLQAKDTSVTRNYSFTSSNFEMDLYGRFYFVDDIVRVAADRSRKPRRVKPYVTLGLGGVLYNPTTVYGPGTGAVGGPAAGSDTITGTNPENKSYPGIALVIPAGLGVSYSFSHRVSLMGEFTYKLTFSDYLDGIGPVTGTAGGLKDNYYMFQLKLQLAPWAAKVKRKKKYKGQPPVNNGGGGTESPNAPSEKPKAEEAAPGSETAPAGDGTTPAPDAPAPETAPAEAPAPETPPAETPAKQEDDGWGEPAKPVKPAKK